MKNVQMKEQKLANEATYQTRPDINKKLSWSLVLAMVPFIPDILGTIRTAFDKMVTSEYALHVKYGQAEIHFNKAELVSDSLKVAANDEKGVK